VSDAPVDLSKVRRARLQAYCPHRSSLVDTQARRIECSTCGAMLDPFDVLDQLVSDVEWMRMMLLERTKLEKDVGDLRAEIVRLKAARRRATPPELRGRGLADDVASTSTKERRR
jgi:hypothetical protein